MDPHARATTWSMIRELRDRGVTVVLTTHAMDEAEQLCDRVAIIDHGRTRRVRHADRSSPRHAAADETTFAHARAGRRRPRQSPRASPPARCASSAPATTSSRPRPRPTLVAAARRVAARPGRARSASCAPAAAPSKTSSSASRARGVVRWREPSEGIAVAADPHRAAAHAATGREPPRHVRDPARRAGLLLEGRRGEHHDARTRSTSSSPACSRSR